MCWDRLFGQRPQHALLLHPGPEVPGPRGGRLETAVCTSGLLRVCLSPGMWVTRSPLGEGAPGAVPRQPGPGRVGVRPLSALSWKWPAGPAGGERRPSAAQTGSGTWHAHSPGVPRREGRRPLPLQPSCTPGTCGSPHTSPQYCPVDGGAFRGLCKLPCSVTQTWRPKARVASPCRERLGFRRVLHGNSFSVFSTFLPLGDAAIFFIMMNNFSVQLVMP